MGNTSATTTTTTTTVAVTRIASASAISCHFSEFRVDRLIRFSENLHQFSGLAGIVTCEEGDSGSLGTSTPCSANTMNVIFVVVRVVIVDNSFDIFYVCKKSVRIQKFFLLDNVRFINSKNVQKVRQI